MGHKSPWENNCEYSNYFFLKIQADFEESDQPWYLTAGCLGVHFLHILLLQSALKTRRDKIWAEVIVILVRVINDIWERILVWLPSGPASPRTPVQGKERLVAPDYEGGLKGWLQWPCQLWQYYADYDDKEPPLLQLPASDASPRFRRRRLSPPPQREEKGALEDIQSGGQIQTQIQIQIQTQI